MTKALPAPNVRQLGQVDYEPTWRAMQRFTESRDAETADEIWFLQHPPVFTLGMNASMDHVLAPGDIPLLQIDRGGQVTYHGPGQLVVYPLLDIARLGITVRALVSALEQAVIRTAALWGIEARGRRDAPGVYVGTSKLASLGLRIRRDCCYHGLALNVDMDLEPFGRINPCGYQGMQITRFADLGADVSVDQVSTRLRPILLDELGLPDIGFSDPAQLQADT
ncbi:MAG: lipoyl(octanoyl) transferase LipB [Gammaproteobacteria bacterium]